MMIKAMEVSGIEGNFRTTCEAVLKVLRTNKDSLMVSVCCYFVLLFCVVNTFLVWGGKQKKRFIITGVVGCGVLLCFITNKDSLLMV